MTIHILLVVAVCLLVAGLAWVSTKLRLSPTVPSDPDETEGHGDREESGADEPFGDELRALREMPLPPELALKPAPQMVADHEALAGISVALDHFDQVITEELSRFLRKQPKTLIDMAVSK